MKNLRPYPAYKPTGLAWLPEVPREWEMLRLGMICSQKSIVGQTEKQLLSVYLNKGVVPFSSVDEKRTNATSESLDKYQLVEPGDFVLNNQQAWRGSVGVSDYEGIVSPAYFVLSVSTRMESRFANYLFRDNYMVSNYVISSKGIGSIQRNLDWRMAKDIRVPVPPPAEQEAIVAYLDEKTAKIDRLIELKEREIKLLNEKKQAVISKVVTRGLDPNAELVDSGVDWIGKVPRGWKVVSLKRVCRLQGGSGFPVEMQGRYEEAIPFIKVNSLASNVSADRKYDTITIAEAKSLSATIFKKGSIVFAKVGAALLLHRFARLPFDCCIDNNMMGTVEINSDPEWLRYTMSLLNFNYFVNPGAVPSVNQSQVSSMKIPLPSLPEQREIVAYLDAEGAKTDKAIAAVTRQIGLLKEYRTRLISDAVTGRIDLRKAVA